jgi:replicative DNA helicase
MTQMDTDRTRTSSGGGRVPPSAIEAEESLIGAMLLSQEAVSVAYETVQAEDFYRPLHGQIFGSIIALSHAGEPVDYVTVQAKLQERGAVAVELAVLSSLQMNTPSAANAQHYAETSFARRLSNVASSRSPERSSTTPTWRPTTWWDSSTRPNERSIRSDDQPQD